MSEIIQWIVDNREWVFSGVGIALATVLFSLFKKTNSSSIVQKQNSGNDSINIQISKMKD